MSLFIISNRKRCHSANSLNSYFGGSLFESCPRHRLFGVFLDFPHCLQENVGIVPRLGYDTHLSLVPRSRMVEIYLHSLIRLHGVLLNWLSPGITLHFSLNLHSNSFLITVALPSYAIFLWPIFWKRKISHKSNTGTSQARLCSLGLINEGVS
jgi:hypothetical protein